MKKLLPSLRKEYERGKRIGFILTIVFPVLCAVSFIVLLPDKAGIALEDTTILIISVIIFAIMSTLMARMVLQRMRAFILHQLNYDRYKSNLLFYAMVIFYLLVFCPALWGLIVYLLVKNLPTLLLLLALSIAGFFFLTPSLEDLLKP